MKHPVRLLTRTAVSLALLVAVQALLAPLNQQLLTGSCVNLILAVSACVLGAAGASAVAVISPFLAFLFGIGPKFFAVRLGIALGNLVYVLVIWALFTLLWKKLPRLAAFPAAAAGAVAKFLVMFLVVVKAIIPTLNLPEAAAATLSAGMSTVQLTTALIGGLAAAAVIPILKKAIKD